ncbi:MAG: hypothetical protein JW754_06070 [Candidatus Aenigmarchaeota archaeon]|nr:hypothetical protein [Candidatus Aenigmarchaeota archaeon]
MYIELALLFGVFIALAHFFSEKFLDVIEEKRKKVMSFVAGISLTYVFLLLMPEIYNFGGILDRYILFLLLVGFAGFHIIEKHIYQHEKKEKLHEQLKLVHSVTFFFYHFLIGFILLNLMKDNVVVGVMFLIPIFFHSVMSGASLKGIHVSIRERMMLKIMLSCSTLLGVVIGYVFFVPMFLIDSMLGFVVGAFLYIVIRDSLPRETKGDAIYFISGLVVYTIIIFFIWNLV